MVFPSMRVGVGYDLHRLEKGRVLILGGVEIPFDRGPRAHSDGDCLLHALCDALLGAAALPDIGCLFPDDDKNFRHRSSSYFVISVRQKVIEAGFRVLNVDAVLCLERPKLTPYREAIRQNLGRWLQIPMENVGLKAKTNEGLGAIGRGQAVAAQVVCLLRRENGDPFFTSGGKSPTRVRHDGESRGDMDLDATSRLSGDVSPKA
ncbi:MAG: 2-C-methyl-D-erythritol 2,4-cyclodiphosphate synthase [Puniceicoccales bacterium]|jgi:2-C-methyl-D-erythritol 2,4-cyclodiphosphate synthase|nr:2-C-methyl-D-erythritol 2,4-cyclodiphosphate synthase [Puniceicoccales bacterium]